MVLVVEQQRYCKQFSSCASTEPIRLFPTKAMALEYAHQCAGVAGGHPTIPVFAYDKEDDSAKKKFIVGGWDAVFDHVRRRTIHRQAYFYEVLQETLPLRLYFDIECQKEGCAAHNLHAESAEESLQAVVNQVKSATAEVVRENLSLDAGDPVILESSRKDKCSCHLVYPRVVLTDYISVGALVADIHERLDDSTRPWVDVSVYDRDRNFRIIGSMKRASAPEKRVDFRVPGSDRSKPLDLTKEAFLRSLVTYTDSIDTPRFTVSNDAEPAAKRFKRAPSRSMTTGELEIADAFESNFEGFDNAEDLCRADIRDERFATWWFKSQHCPNKGAAHKSNKGGFRLNLATLEGWFFCVDPDCKNEKDEMPKWDRKNYRYVLEPGAFRYTHNFFVRPEWYRTLEAFLSSPPVAAVASSAQIRRVEWSPGIRELTVLCSIEPNPCPHKRHRHRANSYTKLVVPSRGRAYWTCCGMGVHKFRTFDAKLSLAK